MKDENVFREIAKQLEIQNAYTSFNMTRVNKEHMTSIDKKELQKKLKYIDEKYSGNIDFMKTTIDSHDDLERVMVTGVVKPSSMRREEMLENVVEYIFKRIADNKITEQEGYECLETVANHSIPPVRYNDIRELWNEHAEESNMKLKE